MDAAIKIVLVDDHRIVLDGLKRLLDNDPDFYVVAAVGSAEEALKVLANGPIDLLLTDYTMQGMTGLELANRVKDQHPTIKRVLLSMHDEAHLIKQIMKAGVDGYLLKSIQEAELTLALKQIMNGLPFVSPEITKMMMADLSSGRKEELLTDREQEILRLIVKEFPNKQIADKLFISERTVETHRKNIFRKTNTGSIVGLVKFAFEHNLV
ncbi:MAG: response regulator transcription factor [Bacteroidetes bacterium]|nr:response regulator transcription factor [Bacteroidota bacterium]